MKTALFAAALVVAAPALAIDFYPTQETFNSVAQRPAIFENDVVLFNNRGAAGGIPVPVPGDVAPVPEPGEWAMMVAGLGVVGYIARRRRKLSI